MVYTDNLKHIDISLLSLDLLTNLKNIIKIFNLSNDINYKKELAYKILELTGFDFGKCRICGEIIIYNHMKFSISRKKILWLITPSEYQRVINGTTYYLSCCEKCLFNEFKNNLPKTNTLIFSKGQRWSAFVYNIPENIAKIIRKETVAVTLKSMIRKYGEEQGQINWNKYRELQRNKNLYKYKKEKYNWTEEEFNNFNKNRAITKELCIKRYGEKNGLIKWNNYLNKLHITKSYDYMVSKYGEDKTKKINDSKAIRLDNFIKKYGEEIGLLKYNNIIQNNKAFYSNISLKFFNELDKYLGNKFTTYYATKNTEFGVNLKTEYVKLDYYIKELNICIEFNGNCFHANPRLYKDNDHPNPFKKYLTAKEIRENDLIRYNKLKTIYGINTFIIWEDEYNKINIQDFIKNILNITIL